MRTLAVGLDAGCVAAPLAVESNITFASDACNTIIAHTIEMTMNKRFAAFIFISCKGGLITLVIA
jgi:hypothetical protein